MERNSDNWCLEEPYNPIYNIFGTKPILVKQQNEYEGIVVTRAPLLGALLFDNVTSDARDHCANERSKSQTQVHLTEPTPHSSGPNPIKTCSHKPPNTQTFPPPLPSPTDPPAHNPSIPILAQALAVHGNRVGGNHHLLPPEGAAVQARAPHGVAAGADVLAAGAGVSGGWVGELCAHGDSVQ